MIKKLQFGFYFALTFFASFQAKAQLDAVTYLKSGASDANKLIGAYMQPMLDGFGASMNNGWYNTGRPHGIGGFDVTMTLNTVLLNDDMKQFDASKLGLNTDPAFARIVPASGALGLSPTIYGSKSSSTQLDVVQRIIPGNPATDTVISSFSLPPGTETPVGVGIPNIQAAVGVGFGTEVMLRVSPKFTFGDFKIQSLGFGVKHSLSHWIFKGNSKPPIDLSLVFGYNKLSASYGFGDNYLRPDSAYANVLPDAEYRNTQKMLFDGTGTMFGVIVSKKISILTLYVGGSYNRSTVNMKMEGNYPITFIETNLGDPNFGKKIILNMKDPINLSSDLNMVKATGGFRLKLTVLTISGEYNYGKISTASLGIGLNLQSIKPFKL